MILNEAIRNQLGRLRREGEALAVAFLISIGAFVARRLLSGRLDPIDVVDLAMVVVAYASSTILIEHPHVVPAGHHRADVTFDIMLLGILYAGAQANLIESWRILALMIAVVLKFAYDVFAVPLNKRRLRK